MSLSRVRSFSSLCVRVTRGEPESKIVQFFLSCCLFCSGRASQSQIFFKVGTTNHISTFFWIVPKMSPSTTKRKITTITPHPPAKRSTPAFRSNSKPAASKNVAAKPLSTLGFLSTKQPKYQIGTKILLDDSIGAKGKAPTEVARKLFVYEIADVSNDGNVVTVKYKKQVICRGGDHFTLYNDGNDQEVRLSKCLWQIAAIVYIIFSPICSTKVHGCEGTHQTGCP
jgi:hypothetical protein